MPSNAGWLGFDVSVPGPPAARSLVIRVPATQGKGELLDQLDWLLGFAPWGRNWDALEDRLRDLGWLEIDRLWIVHEQVPQLADQDLGTYLSILAEVAEHWKRVGRLECSVAFPEEAKDRILALLPERPRGNSSAE